MDFESLIQRALGGDSEVERQAGTVIGGLSEAQNRDFWFAVRRVIPTMDVRELLGLPILILDFPNPHSMATCVHLLHCVRTNQLNLTDSEANQVTDPIFMSGGVCEEMSPEWVESTHSIIAAEVSTIGDAWREFASRMPRARN